MTEDRKAHQFLAASPADLEPVAAHILGSGKRIFLLIGDLGAGKTALVKAFCKVAGSPDEVSSPTFSLVNEYRDATGQPIYHIDLYRLDTLEEILRIGIEEYLGSGFLCFVEWPELILDLPEPDAALIVSLSVEDDGTRRITTLM